MNDLRTAAQAVLDRWDSPAWEWVKQGPTAALMADLRAALAQQAEQQPMHPELQKMWEDHIDKCFRAIPVPEQAEPVVRGAAYADALRWTIKACGAVQRHDGVWFGDDAAARLARVLSEGIAPPQQAEPVEPWSTRERFYEAIGRAVEAVRQEMKIKTATMRLPEYDITLPIIDARSGHVLVGPVVPAPPRRKPLTSDKDRPDQGATYVEGYGYVDTRAVRAIERAHGIGDSK